MDLIPVLDLLDARVVRAVRGARDTYRPVVSSLAAGSEPLTLARALVAASGARALYVADLGAILARGGHEATLAALADALPGVALWVDAGFTDGASLHAWRARVDAHRTAPRSSPAAFVPVFGTETLAGPQTLADAAAAGYAPVLSLDHRAGELLGGARLPPGAHWWPGRVIAMTLDHVGAYDGPDLATLARIRAAAAPGTVVTGAGGIRSRADLDAAAAAGAHAWLVASALHDARLARRPRVDTA